MRKFLSIFAALAIAVGAIGIAPKPVAAASYAGCLDGSTQAFKTGETFSDTGIWGIEATINPGVGFHMCSPAETSITDNNASVLQIALVPANTSTNQGFLTLGVVMCDGPAVNSAPYCKGYPGSVRYFAEYMNYTGNPLLGHGRWDLGAADMAAHTYQIVWDGNSWLYKIDGVTKKDHSGGITVSDGWKGQIQAETHDRNDGIAASGTKSIIKDYEVKLSNGNWLIKSAGTSCSYTSAQISGTCSGYTSYFWTVN